MFVALYVTICYDSTCMLFHSGNTYYYYVALYVTMCYNSIIYMHALSIQVTHVTMYVALTHIIIMYVAPTGAP